MWQGQVPRPGGVAGPAGASRPASSSISGSSGLFGGATGQQNRAGGEQRAGGAGIFSGLLPGKKVLGSDPEKNVPQKDGKSVRDMLHKTKDAARRRKEQEGEELGKKKKDKDLEALLLEAGDAHHRWTDGGDACSRPRPW